MGQDALPQRAPSEALEQELATEWGGFAPPPDGGWFGERPTEAGAVQSRRDHSSVVTFFGHLDVSCPGAGER